MIDKAIAAKHLGRMIGQPWFPTAKKPQMELLNVLRQAVSEESCREAVDDWIANHPEQITAAALRAVIADRNLARAVTRKKCAACSGDGSVTVWKLITYDGRNVAKVKKAETLRDVHCDEEARPLLLKCAAFAEKNPNADLQTVLTAAKPCVCVTAVIVG